MWESGRRMSWELVEVVEEEAAEGSGGANGIKTSETSRGKNNSVPARSGELPQSGGVMV